jgi:hypothetical protein
MTTDDIIRMAREADLWGEIYAMQRFANLVAAAEREWEGLTDEEREEISLELPIDAVRITEAKLKEKNT